MADRTEVSQAPEPIRLNVFCAQENNGVWRVHLGSRWLPPNLPHLFDRKGEAFPVLLDFEDLHRFLETHDAPCEKRVSALGDVELTAHGSSAFVLARWLANAFDSGIRPGRSR